MPKRIQRKRTRGWRLPKKGAVYVGRPTVWGNPFVIGVDGTAQECVDLFAKWFSREISEPGTPLHDFRNKYGWRGFSLACAVERLLGGKDLVCWCPLDQPCHADVLLRIANPSYSGLAEEHGGQPLEVKHDHNRELWGRDFPIGAECDAGAINHELMLEDREWTCQSCGALHDRDLNAAVNIEAEALWLLNQTPVVATSG